MVVTGRFDPRLFFQDARNVALRVAASEIFGLLKRTLDLPPQWAAITRRETGDQMVTRPGGVVDGDEAEDILFVRATPIEIVFNEDGLSTRDGYQCTAEIRCQLSVIPEPSELRSFEKLVLGSHRVVQTHGLARYLEPALRARLCALAAEQDASDLLGGANGSSLDADLTDALQGPLFTAGLALTGTPAIRFESGTFRQVQQARSEAARRHAEHESSRQLQSAIEQAQARHLDHLTSLLARLKELAEASPDVALPDLLRTFSQQQRSELYEALFAAEPACTATRWIVVAAGEELLFFDAPTSASPHADTPSWRPRAESESPAAAEPGSPARRLRVTGAAGPVRSVHAASDDAGRMTLWVGAATGVYRWPINAAEPDLTLLVEDAPAVRGGFNAVAVIGARPATDVDGEPPSQSPAGPHAAPPPTAAGTVVASHSELGLRQWHLSDPTVSRRLFPALTDRAQAVRAVTFYEGDLYCGIDDRVIRWRADAPAAEPDVIYTGSEATITALCITPDGLYAGNSNGDVLYWPADQPDRPERLHTGIGRAAESVWLIPTHGVSRLVYSDTSLSIRARVLGDTFECRYEAGGQTLRRVAVGPDLLAATNDLRDRLIVWSPGHPATPKETIPVARLCGHSIQDVCLVPYGA